MKGRSLVAPLLAMVASSVGCFDNRNAVGSFDGAGGSPIIVGGAGGVAGQLASGGSGNMVGAGPPLVVRCRDLSDQTGIPRDCARDDECALVSDSPTTILPGEVDACTTRTAGIGASHGAELEAFVAACAGSVMACSPSEQQILAEDGNLVPVGTPVAVRCVGRSCRSYVP